MLDFLSSCKNNVVVRDVATRWNPPHAHHRYYLRHAVNNFNDKYNTKVLKDLIYKDECQHQPHMYEWCMEEIKKFNNKSVGWFARWTLKSGPSI